MHPHRPRRRDLVLGLLLLPAGTGIILAVDRYASGISANLAYTYFFAGTGGVAMLVLGLILLYRWTVRNRYGPRGGPGECPGCGYDLRGSGGRCPECGRALASGPATDDGS